MMDSSCTRRPEGAGAGAGSAHKTGTLRMPQWSQGAGRASGQGRLAGLPGWASFSGVSPPGAQIDLICTR